MQRNKGMNSNQIVTKIASICLVLCIALSGCTSSSVDPIASDQPSVVPSPTSTTENQEKQENEGAVSTSTPKPITPAQPVSLRYEAEDGILTGIDVQTLVKGFSGNGYVTNFDQDGDSVEFSVNIPSAGIYNVTIGYRAHFGDKTLNLELNGKASGDVTIAKSADFTSATAGKLLFNKGVNSLKIVKGWGWYDIDYIEVNNEDNSVTYTHSALVPLSNAKATKETRQLFHYLQDQYGKTILSGQQNINNVTWIESKTGEKPAVIGFDFMDYSPSRVTFGAKSSETDSAIRWHQQGGIVTFAWHWNAPKDLLNTSERPWYKGFYTDATTFDVKKALANPDSEEYKLLLSDIDAIAVQLKKLQVANVPVLWRPLHEAEGGWFWWGAKGSAPAKELYRIMYDRLTNVHQLNNLIWVWNSVAKDWYPGDDVVDIVSYDSYPAAGDTSPVYQKYENLVKLVDDRKVVALSENGPIPDPDLLQEFRADWSWFCTWDGYFLTDGIQNKLDHVIKLYKHEYVVTLDELPDLSKYRTE
jgi:mannan endo-1,4-beta-mannosidase